LRAENFHFRAKKHFDLSVKNPPTEMFIAKEKICAYSRVKNMNKNIRKNMSEKSGGF